MIGDKKIEEAARLDNEEYYDRLSDNDRCFFEYGFRRGYNRALKDLWHPMQEEPKLIGEEIIIEMFINGERFTMVQKYMVGVDSPATIETIRWISDWDSFITNSDDDVKMIRWCYFKDLLPKEGGEQ